MKTIMDESSVLWQVRRPLRIRPLPLTGLLILILIIWYPAGVINTGGLPVLGAFLAGALQPDISGGFLLRIGHSSLVTLACGLLGTLGALVPGLIGGVLSSEVWSEAMGGIRRRFWWRPHLLMRLALTVPRAVHEAVWGLILIGIFGLHPLAGLLAIMLTFSAIFARVFSGMLDTVDRAPFRSLVRGGTRPMVAFVYGILPGAGRHLLAYSFYRFECAVRSSVILGMIGAGGLGYELILSVRSMRYDEIWTILYTVMLLNGAVMLWSQNLRRRLAAPGPGRRYARTGGVILVLTILSCVTLFAGHDLPSLSRAASLSGELLASAWPPDFSRPDLLAAETIRTLGMSLLAIVLAVLLALVHTFLWSIRRRREWDRPRWYDLPVGDGLLLLLRTLPAPVWAVLFLFVFYPGAVPGILALGVYQFAVLGRLFTETLGDRPETAARALHYGGSGATGIFLYGFLPGAGKAMAGLSLYRWEICLRETIVVGLVGAGGLGYLLAGDLAAFDYPRISAILFCFLLLTLIPELLSWQRRAPGDPRAPGAYDEKGNQAAGATVRPGVPLP